MKKIIATAAAAAALLAVAAPASAAVSTYGNLGYTNITDAGFNLGAVTARLGAQFNPYIGVEAEGAFGVVKDSGVKLDSSLAAYVVGFWPVSSNADLFARIGYGHVRFNVGSTDSTNYGVGGQYFWGKNGVRVDYTRIDPTLSGASNADAWTVAYVRKF